MFDKVMLPNGAILLDSKSRRRPTRTPLYVLFRRECSTCFPQTPQPTPDATLRPTKLLLSFRPIFLLALLWTVHSSKLVVGQFHVPNANCRF
jgi:hypothetical protein